MTALATKTVIFVTHQVEFLPAADTILVLKEGISSKQENIMIFYKLELILKL